MKTRWLFNRILCLALALLCSGCAAAATTANVVLVAPLPVAETPAPLIPAAARAALPVETLLEPGVEGYLVQITPPPDMAAPEPAASPWEAAKPEASASPAPTEEPTPTPKQTAKPSPTPAYEVEELEEYLDGYVNSKTINLRKGPGTDYEVLGEYERYDELLVTGTCEEWYRVKLDGLRGYMLMEYVTIGGTPTPTPKATDKPKATATPEPVATEAPSASFSDEDVLYLAAQVVYKEGDSESYVAVANVIYNRVQSSRFPDTIYDVVYQKNQFSTDSLKSPSSAAKAAVQQIFVEKNLILPAEVLYFQAASRGTSRSGYNYYATFGGNVFFYK